MKNLVNLVEKILESNNQNQTGQRLQLLTSVRMLSRLPISLAQLQAGNNSEKLKNEIRKLVYYLHCSKDWLKQSISIWLVIFKNGNNLYEHWK